MEEKRLQVVKERFHIICLTWKIKMISIKIDHYIVSNKPIIGLIQRLGFSNNFIQIECYNIQFYAME